MTVVAPVVPYLGKLLFNVPTLRKLKLDFNNHKDEADYANVVIGRTIVESILSVPNLHTLALACQRMTWLALKLVIDRRLFNELSLHVGEIIQNMDCCQFNMVYMSHSKSLDISDGGAGDIQFVEKTLKNFRLSAVSDVRLDQSCLYRCILRHCSRLSSLRLLDIRQSIGELG